MTQKWREISKRVYQQNWRQICSEILLAFLFTKKGLLIFFRCFQKSKTKSRDDFNTEWFENQPNNEYSKAFSPVGLKIANWFNEPFLDVLKVN